VLTLEILCRGDFDLVEAFREGIREGEFKSFVLKRGRGRSPARAEVLHKSPRTPGKISLEQRDSLCRAKVAAPAGKEWDILHKFVGRLVHRFPDRLLSIRVDFPEPRRRRGRRG
jgi:hypothetical protein